MESSIKELGAAVANNPPLSTTTTYNTNGVIGPLLTVSRIQTIGELLANSIDIEQEYFSGTDQTSSDYENFLKVNGKIITFTDSLGTTYKVPTTYINWPPYQNGYPYQVMGANISIGPFEADADLSSEVSYLCCVIEKITGITPNLTLAELSDVYDIDKYSSNILESIRSNNINGPGTFMYYNNMVNTIQDGISNLSQFLNTNGINYGINLTNQLCLESTSPAPPTPASPVSQYLEVGIFGGGFYGSYLSTTSIYTYSSNTTVPGSNLTYNASYLAATGNSIFGVFGGGSIGNKVSTTSIYTYSSNTTAAGTDLTYGATELAATGNSTIGVFGGGYETTSFMSTTSIYTYASNTTAAGANLTYVVANLAAAGNSTVGVFGDGYITGASASGYSTGFILSTTSIYTYTSNTTAAGTDLTYGATNLAAVGNSTLGVFGGGYETTSFTSIYTYSSNTTAAGANLTYVVSNLAAAGNSTVGVFGDGYTGSRDLSTTSIYTYSSNTTTAGANLTYTAEGLAATSNVNGGLQ